MDQGWYHRKLEYMAQLKIKADSRASTYRAEMYSEARRDFIEIFKEEVEDPWPMVEALRVDQDHDKAIALLDEYDLDQEG